MGLALGLAWLHPAIGARGGLLRSELLTPMSVAIVFFLQGLLLPADEVRRGVAAWQVHLFCQAWIFLVFPAMGWLVVTLCGEWLAPAYRIGLLYLSLLPTTIATNAAFSARAGGNAAASLFNIVVSNLAGVVVVPVWLTWLLSRDSGVSMDVLPLVASICVQLLIPFAVGQALRLRWANWAGANRALLREICTWLIFFVIYTAVCNLLVGRGSGEVQRGVAGAMAATLGLLVGGSLASAGVLAVLRWPRDLKISAFYASTQKTLAIGLPVAGAVYGAAGGEAAGLPPMAMVLLPLITFHVGQLILGVLLIPLIASRGRNGPQV